MSTLAKLSKQAVQLEHDRQYAKALSLYARLFDEAAAAGEEVDVTLLNRAGDAAMRLGESAQAVTYFERAIDAYATGGLLNNAIAVANKLLRHAPDHAATHYTLAVLHAKQGFRGDAKQHYVEYAERMHRAGRDDEALRALTEFAALCPPGDDVRAALASHTGKRASSADVAAHLESLLPPTVETPPSAAPAVSAAPSPTAASSADDRGRDLVFLDVSVDGAIDEPMDVPESVAPVAGLEFTAVDEPASIELALDEPDTLDLGSVDFGAGELAVEPLAPSIEPPSTDAPALSLDAWDGYDIPLDDAPASPAAPAAVDLPFVDMADDEAAPSELEFVSLDDAPAAVGDVELISVDGPTLDLAPVALHDVDEIELPQPDAVLVDELPALPLPEPAIERAPEPPAPEAPAASAPSAFIDLGDWLRADEPEPTTRLTSDDLKPTGDEAADFERMLGVFKAGIARNVESTDHASHYDLGVAFREMGLVDEAIAEFQRAARAPDCALRAREALGQCFLDRGSPDLAVGVLERALDDATRGDGDVNEVALLGVVYLLGEAYARLGQHTPARACFQRVVAADIEFRDAARRLTQLPALTPTP